MKAYIDLSLIVHIVIFLISTKFAMIIHDKTHYSYQYKTNHFFLGLIAFLLNLYYIPYFFIFYLIVRVAIMAIFKRKYLKAELITIVYYYLNIAFLVLVGGSFIYDGILYINRPITTLFVLVLPSITIIVILLERIRIKKVKKQNFTCKAILMIDKRYYKIKCYIDTGNVAKFDNVPIIFINFKIKTSQKMIDIPVRTLTNLVHYQAFLATIIIKKDANPCYVIYSNQLELKHHCNCLLNLALFR